MLNQSAVRYGHAERISCVAAGLSATPSAGIPFKQVDEGQAGPRFVRPTAIMAPATAKMQKDQMAFGLLIQPLAEMSQAEYGDPECLHGELPAIDLREGDNAAVPDSPFRCQGCLAYIGRACKFSQGGQKVTCALCKRVLDVPPIHAGPIDEYGLRMDYEHKPEYYYGAYEYILNDNFIGTTAVLPGIVFALDVSCLAIRSGFFSYVIDTIKASLDYMVNPQQTEVLFMTYDHQACHLYSVSQDPNGEPSIMVMAGLDDPFAPVPRERLMLKLVEDRERIDAFLDKLVSMYQTEERMTNINSTASGAAITTCVDLLSKTGGRVILFQAGIPCVGAGNLKNRDEPKLYEQDGEKDLYGHTKEHAFYGELGKKALDGRVVVD